MKNAKWIKAKVCLLEKKYAHFLQLANLNKEQCELNDYTYEKYFAQAELIKAELDAYKEVLKD